VIRNAAMVARNMYRPIDPIGLNISLPDHAVTASVCDPAQIRQPISPELAFSCVHKMAPPRQSYT
jgi:hypothetical protein